MSRIPDLTIGDHTYSCAVLCARHAVLEITAAAQRAVATGRDPGMSQIALLDLEGALEDQAANLHRLTMFGCACGLVTTDDFAVAGHLDLATMSPATTVVLGDHEGRWAWACQQCQHLEHTLREPEARTGAAEHRCSGLWS